MTSALDVILESGIQVAADGAEFADIGYRNYHATDATTNPSLVLSAISQPGYAYLLDDAVHCAAENMPDKDPKEQASLAMDYLLVQLGIEILSMIPGRVSISVDPRLAYDYDGILCKARNLIQAFEEHGIPRERILVKIPATYPGIRAAQTLETPYLSSDASSTANKPIHTNLTLVFGMVQAMACAQAKVSVISPFVGRVKDWWNKTWEKTQSELPLSDHPGLRLVRKIQAHYDSHGYKTQVMAAGFRRAEEVLELAKDGGRPSLVTLPPAILRSLRSMRNIDSLSHPSAAILEDDFPKRMYIAEPDSVTSDASEKNFINDLAREKIAMEKVPEGLEKFIEDTCILEVKLKVQLMLARVRSSPTMPGGWNVRYQEVKL
ncbi:hypothetical protein D9756_009962 [Leucocoprinus leucothites]|uniref:Transaldolase n=1 Tax=Leucocoprinus leucothites TaxID=201217 RepID=A0A8H5FRU2_9AGAR|nr:hypothetical protein D9756_009962 [Leucoagaricus leucothites]